MLDQTDLGFQVVNVFFRIIQDLAEQVARHVVTDALTVSDCFLAGVLGNGLKLQVAVQQFGDVFADQQFMQVLQVWQTVQHEDALDQHVGVFHFANGFFILMLAEFVEAPVVQHAGMQEVLVDGGQLVLELLVQMLDDNGIAFHDGLLQKISMPQEYHWRA